MNKPKLNIIVCVAENNLIGDKVPEGNGLLWHSLEELNYYKSKTVGNVVLFGENTAAGNNCRPPARRRVARWLATRETPKKKKDIGRWVSLWPPRTFDCRPLPRRPGRPRTAMSRIPLFAS